MTTLYHRTRAASAARILEQGFTDSQFNAFDGDSAARGVYLCTGKGNVHSGGNPALLAVEVPDDVVKHALRGHLSPGGVRLPHTSGSAQYLSRRAP